MSKEIVVAIIGAIATIVAAVIAKISTSKKNAGKTGCSVRINQKAKGDNNTLIGTQNNTTIKVGETPLTSGTIIIDGGNAANGGKIEYNPENKLDVQENFK